MDVLHGISSLELTEFSWRVIADYDIFGLIAPDVTTILFTP